MVHRIVPPDVTFAVANVLYWAAEGQRYTPLELAVAVGSKLGRHVPEDVIRTALKSLGADDRVYRHAVRRPGKPVVQGYWLSARGRAWAARVVAVTGAGRATSDSGG